MSFHLNNLAFHRSRSDGECVKTKGLSLRVPMFFIGTKQSCSFFRIFKIATFPDFVGRRLVYLRIVDSWGLVEDARDDMVKAFHTVSMPFRRNPLGRRKARRTTRALLSFILITHVTQNANSIATKSQSHEENNPFY